MKIAIVCDWLVSLGGAEKVLSAIIEARMRQSKLDVRYRHY